MKKFLATGLLAICAVALSQQQASAWVNSNIGGSFNWTFQGSGKSGQHQKHGNRGNGQQYLPSHGYMSMDGAAPAYGYMPTQGYAPSYGYMAQPYGSFDMQMIDPNYAQPMMQYATSPAPVYYYYGR